MYIPKGWLSSSVDSLEYLNIKLTSSLIYLNVLNVLRRYSIILKPFAPMALVSQFEFTCFAGFSVEDDIQNIASNQSGDLNMFS